MEDKCLAQGHKDEIQTHSWVPDFLLPPKDPLKKRKDLSFGQEVALPSPNRVFPFLATYVPVLYAQFS